jgi:hypothetical protein
MKVSTEIDNNFGYEKITQLVDNIPLTLDFLVSKCLPNTISKVYKNLDRGKYFFHEIFYTPLTISAYTFFFTYTVVNMAKRAFSESVVIQIMHQTNERSFIFQMIK